MICSFCLSVAALSEQIRSRDTLVNCLGHLDLNAFETVLLRDRQTDRQTDRQADRQTDRQADRQRDRQTDRLEERQRWADLVVINSRGLMFQ